MNDWLSNTIPTFYIMCIYMDVNMQKYGLVIKALCCVSLSSKLGGQRSTVSKAKFPTD
jgi:hypothetical protein